MHAVGTQHVGAVESRRMIWSDFWLGLTVLAAASIAGLLMIRLLI